MRTGIEQLERSDIARIKRACVPLRVPAGQDLIEKGEGSDDLYIVTEGSFKVYDDTLGEDFVHAILEQGDIFGEMSFIDGIPRSASVRAISDGSVLRMGKGEFDNLLVSSPDTAMLFIFTLARVITRRLRDVNVALRNMTFNESDRDTENVIREVITQMRQAVHIELDEEI
ncbi:MAG: cyclic nucleotide-binding domain-containing protein [Candidatus Fermentibacteraceae bacterium]|nr:cyclic nucleotide-binding domain-containing protein [Candidatus Fermentibacteraceae bacterium]MBN2607696.1 cyclic nucleotide-binding domain-containing protein [Candidatus Fermentibacteraceae bacterium]